MSTDYAPGLHVVTGKAVSASAYDRWVGRWSRLFVPSLLAAAQVSPGCTALDVATGTGEAAAMALSIVGSSGIVVGADIAPEMLEAARVRLASQTFRPAAADGQALPFGDDSFDAVICQLGLQFFPDPALARISHRGRCIGAPFLRKSCWLNGLSQGQGESRCRQSVARRYSNLHASKGAWWWARLMAVRSPRMPVPCCWRRRTERSV